VLADRWGVTDAEVARRYPCDDLLPRPSLQAWRGVDVAAPAGQVWAWVGQVRLAPYSYDWIDNLGRRSPRTLRRLPDPVAGEPFTAIGGRPAGRILSVELGVQLTGTILGAVLSYVIEPAGPDASRLLLKVVSRHPAVLVPALCLGDLVMARRQLRNLARLAERSWRTS
jgi:hypothetical protein